MKVTIITCTNNSESTLAWNLKSIAMQTYLTIEHIIIDNNSSDNTLNIVQQFPHISSIISEPDDGIYYAMNKGLEHATGDIIGFLNSDDYFEGPDVIAKIVHQFNVKKCDAVYGSLIYVKNEALNIIHRVWLITDYEDELPYNGWMLPHPTFYVRKEIYNKYGFFNTNFRFAADYEIILRFLMKFNINVSPIHEVLVYMRTGGVTNKDLTSRIKVHNEDRLVWKSLGLKPKWYTLLAKPLRKLMQFIIPYFSIKWRLHITPDYDTITNCDYLEIQILRDLN